MDQKPKKQNLLLIIYLEMGLHPASCVLGHFCFVQTGPEGGERQWGDAQASSVVDLLTYLI